MARHQQVIHLVAVERFPNTTDVEVGLGPLTPQAGAQPARGASSLRNASTFSLESSRVPSEEIEHVIGAARPIYLLTGSL